MSYMNKAKQELLSLSTLPEDVDTTVNHWAPYKTMHEHFVATFKKWYSAHEAMRGSKLTIR
jgi:hypothetical protein